MRSAHDRVVWPQTVTTASGQTLPSLPTAASGGVVPTSIYGECQLLIVELPLPNGAIGVDYAL
jgi:hypothetical protein